MGGSSNDNREYDYCTGLKHIALFFLGIVFQQDQHSQHTYSNVQHPGRPALSLSLSLVYVETPPQHAILSTVIDTD